MLSINPRNDLFRFYFPENFFRPSIINKYTRFLKQEYYYFDDFQDVINESIKELVFPSVQYTPQEQIQSGTSGNNSANNIYYRTPENIQRLQEKTVEVTLRHTDGYITYFCLLEHFYFYFNPENNKERIGNMSLQTLSSDGYVMTTLYFKNCIFTGISELPLSYANQDRPESTFTITFYFNLFDTTFSLPKKDIVN